MKKPKNWDEKVVFSFRIDASTYAVLKAVAENEKRSINKQLEIFLDDALNTYTQEHEDLFIPDQEG